LTPPFFFSHSTPRRIVLLTLAPAWPCFSHHLADFLYSLIFPSILLTHELIVLTMIQSFLSHPVFPSPSRFFSLSFFRKDSSCSIFFLILIFSFSPHHPIFANVFLKFASLGRSRIRLSRSSLGLILASLPLISFSDVFLSVKPFEKL